MSDFQLSLLLLGIAVVGAVFGYNAWQERRFRKQTHAAFQRNHQDVLLEMPHAETRDALAERLAPSLDDFSPNPLDTPSESSGETQADTLIRQAHTPPPAPSNPLAVLADKASQGSSGTTDNEASIVQQALIAAMLDPQLDFVADIRFTEPVKFDTLPTLEEKKRVQILGSSSEGMWEVIKPHGSYRQLNIGLQMVDRNGAVTEADLAAFCTRVQVFAESYGTNASFPQRQTKLNLARDVDSFCAEVDVLIGLNLRAALPFAGTRLRSLAEAAGMQLENDGAFHYLSDSGKSLYTLADARNKPLNTSTLAEQEFTALTLLFDVPRVAGGISVFDRAVTFSRQLAAELGADLMDDNNRPLSDTDITTIRQQLQHIYSRMDDRGIAPGSVAALRLFA